MRKAAAAEWKVSRRRRATQRSSIGGRWRLRLRSEHCEYDGDSDTPGKMSLRGVPPPTTIAPAPAGQACCRKKCSHHGPARGLIFYFLQHA